MGITVQHVNIFMLKEKEYITVGNISGTSRDCYAEIEPHV
jgi:hypothetical protein